MEPITITTITVAAIKLLSPYLEEASKGLAKKAGEEVGKSSAEGAMTRVKHVYDTIMAKFHGNPVATASLEKLAKDPDDADTQAAARVQLKEALVADEPFALQLAQLLKDVHAEGADIAFNTNIQGDVKKLTNIGVVHGDVNI